MQQVYPLDQYDRHFCLTPGKSFWLMVIYLSSGLLLFLVHLLGYVKGDGGQTAYLLRVTDPAAALAAVPALAVAWALQSRRPGMPSANRLLLRHGKSLLALAVLLNLATVITTMVRTSEVSLAGLLFVLLDCYALIYILQSTRLTRSLADVPRPAAG